MKEKVTLPGDSEVQLGWEKGTVGGSSQFQAIYSHEDWSQQGVKFYFSNIFPGDADASGKG